MPKRFRTTVAGLVGDQELSAVATVTTRRIVRRLVEEDGRVLAEVADDHVEAIRLPVGHNGSEPRDTPPPMSWRGLEVEIVEGERKLLDRVGKRLIKAGARRTAGLSKIAVVMGEEARGPEGPTDAEDTVQQFVQQRLAILVTDLRTRDPLVREGLPEGVHT